MAYAYSPLLSLDLDKYRSDEELNAIYLRLDTTNDPLTNDLDIGANNYLTTGDVVISGVGLNDTATGASGDLLVGIPAIGAPT